jgi:hypothetical protein
MVDHSITWVEVYFYFSYIVTIENPLSTVFSAVVAYTRLLKIAQNELVIEVIKANHTSQIVFNFNVLLLWPFHILIFFVKRSVVVGQS